MKKWIESLPKFVLGPLAVLVSILYFTVQDPPKTICDTQFEIFKKEEAKYIFPYKKGEIDISAGIKKDIESCRLGNSPGACYDWLEGLKKLIHLTRNIPATCAGRIGDLAPLSDWLDQSVFLFSQISWNSTNVIRDGLNNWLEDEEVIRYCQLKNEYIRLRGDPAWQTLQAGLLEELIKIKKMDRKRAWERTILSHHCRW